MKEVTQSSTSTSSTSSASSTQQQQQPDPNPKTTKKRTAERANLIGSDSSHVTNQQPQPTKRKTLSLLSSSSSSSSSEKAAAIDPSVPSPPPSTHSSTEPSASTPTPAVVASDCVADLNTDTSSSSHHHSERKNHHNQPHNPQDSNNNHTVSQQQQQQHSPPPPPSTTTTTTTTTTLDPDNPYSSIRYTIVQNDGAHTNLVRLIGLKSLFAKQLPKMPKDYIVRLVFDRRHRSLAILSDDPPPTTTPNTNTNNNNNPKTNKNNNTSNTNHNHNHNHNDPTAATNGSDDEIIGGICYRPYPQMRFAEIAFCAVNGSHQVKGYGTKLMNLLKRHAVETEGIDYFITYADNYAIGYFKKQGFTKVITMPKSRYHGLIKDYDGANVMECYIHPSVDYTRIPEMVKVQKEFVLARIRSVSKSDKVVYPPLEKGWYSKRKKAAAMAAVAAAGESGGGGGGGGGVNNADPVTALLRSRSSSTNPATTSSSSSDIGTKDATDNHYHRHHRDKPHPSSPSFTNKDEDDETTTPTPASLNAAIRAYAVPGIPEAGWKLSDLLLSTKAAKDSDRQKNHLKSELLALVRKTEDQQFSWPFREPVDTAEVKDYLDVISDPIDLSTIEKKIEKGDYYKSKEMLKEDLVRMVENCKLYNDSSSPYYECAVSLERFLETLFPDLQ